MGPTKAIIKGNALYSAKTQDLIKDGLSSEEEREEYATHHYIVLPVVDKAGREWMIEEGQPVYCLHGTQYETVEDKRVHVSPCPHCGGMGVRLDEPMIETDCVHCTSCGNDFDCRLEMMES